MFLRIISFDCHITLLDQYYYLQVVDKESRGQEGYLPKVTLQIIRVLIQMSQTRGSYFLCGAKIMRETG